MANTKSFTRSFSGGELSPSMFGRIDDSKFQMGASLLRNFIATPQGPAENRPGLAYVNATKGNGRVRLIPFIYSINQTMVLEFGGGYIRFHTQGQTLKYAASQRAYIPTKHVTFSIGSPTVVSWPSHGLNAGDPITFFVILPTGGTMPNGMSFSTTYYAYPIDADTLNIKDAAGNLINTTDAGAGTIYGGYVYQVGQLFSYGGTVYYRRNAGIESSTTFLAFNWYGMPYDLTYEIPSLYAADDLFDIHYAQSADVMTLVHTAYYPQELKRLGATQWILAPINFGTTIDAPTNTIATASPGYLAKIATISIASPALITTVSSHTLSLGDGIYISGLSKVVGGIPTDISGFYLVNKVPIDVDGNLIDNELEVMDYDGNVLDSSGWDSWTGPATIQLGTKVYDINNYYAVAAIGQNGTDQSLISAEASALCNLNVPGSYNFISWDAIDTALRYYIYKKKNSLWGYIGETTGTTFIDNNIAPDFSITPPNLDNPINSFNDYPGAVSYFEQRRVFAGSLNRPQSAWMTNSGTESTFTYSLPTQDSDRISFRAASLQTNIIRHLVPLTQLLMLTSAGEFAVNSAGNIALTPSNVGCRQQAYVGASNVQPTITNNSLVYCAARGGHVRELGYSWESNGFITGDISLRAIHLFDNLTIVDQAFMKAPRPIVWFVSSSGDLLGLTYIPEEQIGAWHHHDTDGVFESIAVVAEGSEDRLYAVIRRQINGNTVRYIERMASRLISDLEDCFFVDAGMTYDGAPATAISGLDWLEGKEVAILADGAVQNRKTVSGGKITLDYEASKVQIGLPYQSDLYTLPLTLQVDGFGTGRQLNLNKCWIRTYQSSSIFVGPDEDHLIVAKQRTDEPYGTPPVLQTGVIEVVLAPAWQNSGQAFIRQDNPLPLTVVSLTLEVAIGG